ncbi:MAG: chemotaxis protein CheX [Campylobacterales bacterium]|nr:chemotaxis protein CheX [Campylobacterales bacterium]
MEKKVSSKKDNILIISPKNYLDNDKASEYVEKFNKDIAKVDFSKVDAVVVSLLQVSSFNRNGIILFTNFLISLKKYKLDLLVGFVDYDDEQFYSLRQMFDKNLNIALYKDIAILSCFIKSSKNKNRKLLLYVDNKNQENWIFSELVTLGFTVVIAKNDEDFEKLKADFEKENIITQTQLAMIEDNIASRVVDEFVIYYPEGSLDGESETKFNYKIFHTYIMQGFSVFGIDFSDVEFINNRGANFIINLQKQSYSKHIKVALFNIGADLNQNIIQYINQHDIVIFKDEKSLLNDSNLISHAKKYIEKNSSNIGFSIIKKSLPQIIESVIESIDTMLDIKCEKKELKAIECNLDLNLKAIASEIDFKGSVNLKLIFVYDLELAKDISKKMLLIEKVGINDLLDSISEITNILSGAIKTVLSNDGQKISLSTPKTERFILKLFEPIVNKKAIKIEFISNKQPLFLYLIP